MKIATLTLAATLMAGAAFAQTAPTPGNSAPGATSVAPMPGVNPSTGVTPPTSVTGRNTGTAAAAGDSNQAVATTSANAPQPARGRNSFSMGEARRRIESRGFTQVTGLAKDGSGVWRGTGMSAGSSMPVWLDYKGNVSPGGTMPAATTGPRTMAPGTTSAPGMAAPTVGSTTGTTMGTGRNIDGTTGNPPGTAATRAMDRTLGTNTTGTNPAGTATRP